jgi:hypothetical protein
MSGLLDGIQSYEPTQFSRTELLPAYQTSDPQTIGPIITDPAAHRPDPHGQELIAASLLVPMPEMCARNTAFVEFIWGTIRLFEWFDVKCSCNCLYNFVQWNRPRTAIESKFALFRVAPGQTIGFFLKKFAAAQKAGKGGPQEIAPGQNVRTELGLTDDSCARAVVMILESDRRWEPSARRCSNW